MCVCIKIISLGVWKMLVYLNLEFFYRIKTKLDQGGVIQDLISALEQLSNPEMLFKVM